MGKEKFRVEYTTLLKENQKGPLKEVVRASELRPVPPEIRVSSFNMLDKMDAYNLDGWWMGWVTGRKDGLKYIVHFECSRDDYD
ncbi:hypothetical protein Vadar_020199 [Vaccinium darrowii]|uniref:Uncharacterized protein n=1 Tax=Vaccinium darrowii TaxID=229202 RepID=A0ACB7XRW3_9ERIC|nr:hypothetical protein Vadar_020199 [Vaccinium darrowii]